MSHLHYFEAFDCPIKGKIKTYFLEHPNKIAHGGHYNPIFATVPFGGPQKIPVSK